MRRALLILAFLSLPSFAGAQDAGGLKLDNDVLKNPDNQSLAIQHTVQMQTQLRGVATNSSSNSGSLNTNGAGSSQTASQQSITKLRGDSGFLGGFQAGQPTQQSAFDRRVKVAPLGAGGDQPFVGTTVNEFTGPVSVIRGNNNVVQQQQAGTSGPTAQQQTVTAGSAAANGRAKPSTAVGGSTNGGGNSNVASGPGATAQQQVVTVGGP